MQSLSKEDIYKLMDDFSINDAACLISGVSPHKYYYNEQYEEWGFRELTNQDPENVHEAVQIAKKSLCNAIKRGKLRATVVISNNNTKYLTKVDMSNDWFLTHELDETRTTIDKVDLMNWLRERGVFPTIFFPQGKIADISNKSHPLYSPKLHAVVSAWESLFTADIQGTTTKKYLAEWLSKNSENFALNITSASKFDDLAEIANFDKKGMTITGNPLHHFGGDAYKQTELSNESKFNESLLAKIPNSVDPELSDDLLF